MRVLSAIQPSGQLHLGNYFGSIRPNLEFIGQAEQSFYFIVDLHALTTLQDAALLRKYRQDAVLDLLACGLDPEKAILFYQSDVPEHMELMWILSTITPMGLLERAVSYKEKIQKGLPASAGLFNYPVLMAADILLYDANVVPVGRDQQQHLEMARDIATRFNHAFGETFVVPEVLIREEVAVVPGIDGQKMSKSYRNIIPLFGEEEQLRRSIMSIVTDSKGAADPKDPKTSVIFQIHKLFLSKSEEESLALEYRKGLSYGEAKERLFRKYLEVFGSMRQRRTELAQEPHVLDEIMAAGARKASAVARKTMERVRKAVGLR